MPDGLFSIIIPAKNEGSHVKTTVDSILRTEGGPPYEIIVVDDASSDGCCSFLQDRQYRLPNLKVVTTGGLGAANARNAGADMARGEILVFCDAHITVPSNWLRKMEKDFSLSPVAGLSPGIASMADPKAVGYGQTWNARLEAKWLPRPAGLTASPLLPGGCQAFRREAFMEVGGYDRGFRVWGREDEEISLKMWLFGYSLFVDPEIKILHNFRPSHPYPVSMDHVNYNYLRMACSHFGEKRLAYAFSLLRRDSRIERQLASVFLSDVWSQRADYLSRRKHDDEWFVQRFDIPF
ncbi:MAG: glycosyltransferase [Peptococcaceae bacterium]|nr:glycosyltransferase [Peptococcaceae bacterium]